MEVRDIGNATELDVKCTYDAGTMGCGEGLHREFRRQMQALDVGDIMEFLVRDPSAKEDLPPLARMMGFRIRSQAQRDDGVMSLVVERAR
jgi:TusA-related sulfurtransferase